MLLRKLLKREVVDRIAVSREEVEKYYQEHRDKFRKPEEVRVRQIVTKTEEEAEKLREEFRAAYAGLLRDATDKATAATLAFGIALFARNEDEKRKWLRNALHSHPEHYYALCKLGEDLWVRGELEEACYRSHEAPAEAA